MICSYDITNLNAFLKNFYNAVGIRISVFDNEFQLVTEYPENAPKFCSLIRNTPFRLRHFGASITPRRL